MKNLKNPDQAGLIDLLSQKTNEHMKMFREGATQKEYETCKKTIDQLTVEIESREKKIVQLKDGH